MASTFDTHKSALQNASPDQRVKLVSNLYGYLQQLERQQMKSADVRDKSMLEAQLKTRKDSLDFTAKMEGISSANARARLAAAAKVEATAIKSVEDYATKYAGPYDPIVQAAQDRARRSATLTSRGRLGSVVGVLIQRATSSSMRYDRNNPKFLKTFEDVIAAADPDQNYFTRDGTGKVTGFTEEGSVLMDAGDLDTMEDAGLFEGTTIAGTALRHLWTDYESRKARFETQTRDGKATLDKAQALRKKAEKATGSKKLELIAAYNDHMQQYFGMTFNQYNIGDLESVQKRVNAATSVSTTYRDIRRLIDQVIPSLLSAGPKSSKMGKYIMNPRFRQWAKDHGFESIGTGKKSKDGTWSYHRGGDDDKAFDLFLAQQKKGKFNYGFMRNAGTGETVQVTLKDGTTLSGERAKVHAGDPKDILRIITPEGDVEFINTSEDIEGDVIILEEAPEKKGIREKIMGRRGVRRKDETAALVDAAAEDAEGILEDVAMVGDQYVQDESGRYLSSDEYDKRREDRIEEQRTSRVFMKVADGKAYLVSGRDVYSISRKGKLTKLEGQEETDVLDIKDSDPLVVRDGESARYATAADLEGGEIEIKSMVQPGETDLLKAAEDIAAEAVSAEALGARLTDTPGYVSEPMGERAGVPATTPPEVDLPEDPDEPEIEVPAKPWSPDDLDKKQKKLYDKRLVELETLVDQDPAWKDDPKSRADMLAYYTDKLNQKFRGLAPGEESPKVQWEHHTPEVRDDLDEEEEEVVVEPPTGPLSEAERALFQDPVQLAVTHPDVISQLAERHEADPETTSYTVGEQLEAVEPATKRQRLTEMFRPAVREASRQRRGTQIRGVVTSSKDLSELMRDVGNKEVDVYETGEGDDLAYVAMYKGVPLHARLKGRLLTDIKAPKLEEVVP